MGVFNRTWEQYRHVWVHSRPRYLHNGLALRSPCLTVHHKRQEEKINLKSFLTWPLERGASLLRKSYRTKQWILLLMHRLALEFTFCIFLKSPWGQCLIFSVITTLVSQQWHQPTVLCSGPLPVRHVKVTVAWTGLLRLQGDCLFCWKLLWPVSPSIKAFPTVIITTVEVPSSNVCCVRHVLVLVWLGQSCRPLRYTEFTGLELQRRIVMVSNVQGLPWFQQWYYIHTWCLSWCGRNGGAFHIMKKAWLLASMETLG